MFGRLAESNAMAQILYGLALRSVTLPKSNCRRKKNLRLHDRFQTWLGHHPKPIVGTDLPVTSSLKFRGD